MATERHVKHFTPVSGDMVLVTAERVDLHFAKVAEDDKTDYCARAGGAGVRRGCGLARPRNPMAEPRIRTL